MLVDVEKQVCRWLYATDRSLDFGEFPLVKERAHRWLRFQPLRRRIRISGIGLRSVFSSVEELGSLS